MGLILALLVIIFATNLQNEKFSTIRVLCLQSLLDFINFAISIRGRHLIPDKRPLKYEFHKLLCGEKGFGRLSGTTLEFCIYIFK